MTVESVVGTSQRRRVLVAVIAATTIYSVTLGLSLPLLSLILEARGVERSLIGLSAAMSALAMLVFAPAFPRLVAATGFRRFLALCIGGELVFFLLLPVFDNLAAWFVLRFLLGVTQAGLFMAAETWINTVATETSRGRVLGIYTAVLGGGFALGPMIVAQTGTVGWTPFLVGGAIIAVSAIPLALTGSLAPRLEGQSSFSPFSFILVAPVLAGAFLLVSFRDSSGLVLLPVYGVRSGLSQAESALMISILAIGGVAMQVPIGWLADKLNRYALLIACALLSTAGIAALPFVVASPHLLWPSLFFWGGVSLGVYTVAMTLVGQRFRGMDLVNANAAIGLFWGIGSFAGPAVSGPAMDLWDPNGLPAVLGCSGLIYAVFVAIRRWMAGRRSPQGEA